MKTRKTLAAALAAAALSAMIAGPASAAPPSQYGVITCSALGDPEREMSDAADWTKKAIAAHKRNDPAMGDCDHGSIGFLILDPSA